MSLIQVSILAVCVILLCVPLIACLVQSYRFQRYENAIATAWGDSDVEALAVSDSLGPITSAKDTPDTARRVIDLVARAASGNRDPPPGGKYIAALPATATPNVFIYRSGGIYLVSFRGTATSKEISLDFKTDQVALGDSRVHSGFYCVYEVFRDALLRELKDAETVIIGGHSLGGALALLLAYDLGPSVQTLVYTFGSPKVGDPAFAKSLAAKRRLTVIRYNNSADVICGLPMAVMPNLKNPRGQLAEYVHFGDSREFQEFRGSWRENHTLRLYADFIE